MHKFTPSLACVCCVCCYVLLLILWTRLIRGGELLEFRVIVLAVLFFQKTL